MSTDWQDQSFATKRDWKIAGRPSTIAIKPIDTVPIYDSPKNPAMNPVIDLPNQGGIPYGDDMIGGAWTPTNDDIIRVQPTPLVDFYSPPKDNNGSDFGPPKVDTWSLPGPAQPGPLTDIPIGPPTTTAVIPPTTNAPVNDLTVIADVYGKMFPGGGTDSIPSPTEQGPVLLYPVNYQQAAAPSSSSSSFNPLIFLVLAAIGLVGFFVYKHFHKKG